MESRLPKIKSIVKQTANWVIRIMGSLILLFLVWYAMRTLQYMLPVAGHEVLVEIPDSVIWNLAAAALILLLYAVLTAVEKKAGDKIVIWCKRIAVTLGMLWQGIAGLCWVLAVDRVPSADQASVIGAAIDFIQGDYGTLAPDHYCGLYGYTTFNAVRYFEHINVKDSCDPKNDAPEMLYILYKYLIVFNDFRNEMLLLEMLQDNEESHLDYVEKAIHNRNYTT